MLYIRFRLFVFLTLIFHKVVRQWVYCVARYCIWLF